jgi:prepilin-type N-terminal cleavage/methylation domain-containing protein
MRIRKQKNNIKGNQSGFTIIEVLISIGILGVGIMAISLMQAHFAGGNSKSRQIIHATDIAMNQIELLDNITDLSDSRLSAQPSQNPHTETIDIYGREYSLLWNVTDNNDGTLTVDVSVSWNDNGLQQTLNFPWVKSI